MFEPRTISLPHVPGVPIKKAVRLFTPDGFLNQGEIFSYERECLKIKSIQQQLNHESYAEAFRFS